MLRAVQVADDPPRERERVVVVQSEVVGHARHARVDVGAAQLFGGDDLAGGGLHERRSAEEDRALVPDDDRLVGHRRHVGAPGGARSHDDGDLRNAERRHRRLVVEDAAEVIAVGEHVDLVRQVGAARVDEIDARQAVLARDLLRPHVLLHGERIVGAALDRRVVADDDALATGDAPDAGDDARRRDVVAVHAVRRELRELEERRSRIDQRADALARQELAARDVLGAGARAAAFLDLGDLRAQVGDERRHRVAVVREHRVARVELRFDDGHGLRRQGSGCPGIIAYGCAQRGSDCIRPSHVWMPGYAAQSTPISSSKKR